MPITVQEHYLPNGLRVVVESMPRVRSAAMGFLIRTGSRWEAGAEHGVSHFLEHMCFKGTERRTCEQINVRFDDLGSIYNAFTGKEHTFYYGWLPAARGADQLELLADMMRPTLPPEDYETERKVILEEIAMNADNFGHHVWNFLHETLFPGHPLAHEILGEKDTIAELPRQTMVDYLAARYAPNNVTLIATGQVEPAAVFATAGQLCERWVRSRGDGRHLAPPPPPPRGVFKLQLPQFKQHSLIAAYRSVPVADARAESIEAFTSLFGGFNSRCYWNIVQKGVCSQAGAMWLAYQDCGVMALYADGEPERCEEILAALRAQAEDVCRNGFRDHEVQRVKNRRRTQLAIEGENPRTRLMQVVDDLESHDHVRSSDERLAAVEAISAASIQGYLREFPIVGEGALLSCGPRDWPA